MNSTLKPIRIKSKRTRNCLNADTLEYQDCTELDLDPDPYHIFLMYEEEKSEEGKMIIISPIAGRCVGWALDGKMVFDMDCTGNNDFITYKDVEF